MGVGVDRVRGGLLQCILASALPVHSLSFSCLVSNVDRIVPLVESITVQQSPSFSFLSLLVFLPCIFGMMVVVASPTSSNQVLGFYLVAQGKEKVGFWIK